MVRSYCGCSVLFSCDYILHDIKIDFNSAGILLMKVDKEQGIRYYVSSKQEWLAEIDQVDLRL